MDAVAVPHERQGDILVEEGLDDLVGKLGKGIAHAPHHQHLEQGCCPGEMVDTSLAAEAVSDLVDSV